MFKPFFFLLVSLFVYSSCARVGRPTGGERDRKPPITLSATPDFNTVNFQSDKIKIQFDEYIKFKDLNKQLIVSPPLKYPLDITPLGTASKYILLKIKDTLQKKTTYTINFGNAIVDNSEGNILKQFKYVFSTGTFIDSLQVSGTVKDAFKKKVESTISILLYAIDSTYRDSIIYKKKPNYITNILDTTAFSITNIKEGKYLLIALQDASSNMHYDQKEDKIAFLDSGIRLPSDSSYNLRLFKEKPIFKLKKPEEISKNHSIIGFEGDFLETSVVAVSDKKQTPVPFFSYRDRLTDSIHIWYKDVKTDTLIFNLKTQDSLQSFFVRHRAKEVDSLQLVRSSRQTLPLRDSLFVLSNIPIEKIDKKYITFIDKDSTSIPFQISKSPLQDKFQIVFKKQYSTNYYLNLYPKAVTDFLGHVNDTLSISFNTKKPEDYGEINLKLKRQENTPVILELFTDKGVLVSRDYVEQDKTLKYTLLTPSKYYFRAILDTNRNKKWDSGNFLKRRQPEKVIYYAKEIEVRANWVISEEFIVK